MPLREEKSTGRPGIGQERFPEAAKEAARRMALYSEEVIVLRQSEEDDGGGSPVETFTPDEARRGRIDAAGGGAAREIGGVINEGSTHIVTVDAGLELSSLDRIEIAGVVWRITAIRARTDEPVTRVEVKEI